MKPVIIFSVSKGKITDGQNTAHVKKMLTDSRISFKMVLGVFKGTQEHSFVVYDNEVNRKEVARLLTIYDQECALLLDSPDNRGHRKASLLFENGMIESLDGKWQCVEESELNGADHTYDYDYERYYVVK